jgi:N utilization substance protein B
MSVPRASKRASRIAAVQMMYQKDVSGMDVENIFYNFVNYYMKESNEYDDINYRFFKRLVSYFSNSEINFEDLILKTLPTGKTTYAISAINKSILKVAIIEIIFEKTDIPVIINEYVEITKLFSDLKSAKFINAILDKISKQVERKCQIKA